MKTVRRMFILLICMMSMAITGCGSQAGKGISKVNSVDNVIASQINEAQQSEEETETATPEKEPDQDAEGGAESEATTEPTTEPTETSGTEPIAILTDEMINGQSGENNKKNDTGESVPVEEKKSNVDYDLTQMNSDMVYAMVYQMMVTPEQYVGKTFRMDGIFYSSYYDTTNQYYFYCVIQDALACCAQGIEFVWDDGSHIYPDEYPAEAEEIIVEGTFETYTEEGDENLYCHLVNATWEKTENG